MPKTKKTKPQETDLEYLQGIIAQAKYLLGRAAFDTDENEKFSALIKARKVLSGNKRHSFPICETCGSQSVRRIYFSEIKKTLKNFV